MSAGRPSLLWMREVSAEGIGTKELGDARAEFHEHWRYGSEQIEELTGKFADSVGESLLELVPHEQQAGFLEQLAQARALTSEMQREGVVSFAIGAHEGDDGALLESVVMLARREIPWTPPKLAAAQAATARKNALPIAVVDLPCGPGAFTESLVELPEQADSRQRSLYEVTAYLPFPDGRNLGVLTLTTTAVDARENYRDIHRAMAEMVSFDNPLPEEFKAQIPESEIEASVRAVFG
ncbi:hypothetical protein [Streptomyces canus]|uniref:hypothetical protein n=1 Tax=Streptomyces canus TaxID=58343 RepID=UPI00278051E7|nr:hypothetical protein [Streptomyces canus]MDQ0764336.1 hypothetical protein [Streptomyces canus]